MSNSHYPDSLNKLIQSISRLPGIGKRTAERLALALFEWSTEELQFLGEQITSLKENVLSCKKCGNFSDGELCSICIDPARHKKCICVVESASQIPIIEKSGSFRGLYYVLGGRLSPVNGIGPDKLRIQPLLESIDNIDEIIFATSPDFDGEATASYIAGLLEGKGISLSRIARGIPVGADISYADAASMAMAMNSRREFT